MKNQVGTSMYDDKGHGEEIANTSFRCPRCRKCGCKGHISVGTKIEIQCRWCKTKYVLKGN